MYRLTLEVDKCQYKVSSRAKSKNPCQEEGIYSLTYYRQIARTRICWIGKKISRAVFRIRLLTKKIPSSEVGGQMQLLEKDEPMARRQISQQRYLLHLPQQPGQVISCGRRS